MLVMVEACVMAYENCWGTLQSDQKSKARLMGQ